MSTLSKIKGVLLKEGIPNYIKRKLNITFLDSEMLYKIKYTGKIVKIYLNPKFGFVDKVIFKNGIYEKEIVDDIVNSLTKDSVMLDIGANIGQHSLLAASYCKEIHAFEPIPEVFKQFQKSVAVNGFTNLHLYNIGISDRKTSLHFNYITNHAGSSSFVETDNPNVNILSVQTDTLENIFKDKKVDVIKIDVEGFEAVVIFGNKEFILRNRPVIFMEFAPESIKKEGSYTPLELFKFFLNNGYAIYSRNLSKTITRGDNGNLINDNWILTP